MYPLAQHRRPPTTQSLGGAAEAGCEHYFAALTTPQSQKIFAKLSFQTLQTLEYENFRDAEGDREAEANSSTFLSSETVAIVDGVTGLIIIIISFCATPNK